MRKWTIAFLVLVAGLLLSSRWWWAQLARAFNIFNVTGGFLGAGEKATISGETTQIVQIIISGVLLCASIYVILAKKYGPKDKHWAYGMVGTLVGFWLK